MRPFLLQCRGCSDDVVVPHSVWGPCGCGYIKGNMHMRCRSLLADTVGSAVGMACGPAKLMLDVCMPCLHGCLLECGITVSEPRASATALAAAAPILIFCPDIDYCVVCT